MQEVSPPTRRLSVGTGELADAQSFQCILQPNDALFFMYN